MKKFNPEAFRSPAAIFLFYILGMSLIIMIFRVIIPGAPPPLEYYAHPWRLLRGVLTLLSLFPALTLSGLVLPFAINLRPTEKIAPFSPGFLLSLRPAIFTALTASCIWALLFFLAQPAARDYEANLVSRGRLYHDAAAEAAGRAADGQWDEADRFLTICENIWPLSPGLEDLRNEIQIETAERRYSAVPGPQKDLSTGPLPSLAGQKPLTVLDALDMARDAMAEERWFDAHWLATTAQKLAKSGSPEEADAVRLAGQAWNAVSSMEPTKAETDAWRVYRLKKDGYESLVAGDWIKAFYIFSELLAITPDDPDAARYLALSQQGTAQIAFFTDEIEMDLGETLPGALFSLPLPMDALPGGRAVLRIASLSVYSDTALGLDIEILAFDADGAPAWRMAAPFVKMLPLAVDGAQKVTVLMRALDRNNEANRWEPEAEGYGRVAPSEGRISFDLPWDDFIILSELRRGQENMSAASLLAAVRVTDNRGYLPQIFQAELVSRFAGPVFFLPFTILVIVIGWRFRALKRPRYILVPMMGLLPLVFSAFLSLCKTGINDLSIWAVLSLGFLPAAALIGLAALILFFAALIILAGQHG